MAASSDSSSSVSIQTIVDEVYRVESRRVFATLVRLLGDFDQAEEALHEAFVAAVEQWPREGVPQNPRAWLVSAGRFKAIDAVRRRARFDSHLSELAARGESGRANPSPAQSDEPVEDDRLRLIFTCCHPALAQEVQVALTLREVCGLTTEEIASAFLASPSTLAQRIVRGKAKIRDAGIPYHVPEEEELPGRLEAVLQTIYLVFNEGYSASSGDSVTRAELSEEAIRLGRLLVELLPDPEALGLLALMLLQESRRQARVDDQGELILLEDQDRSLWNRTQIVEGQSLAERAMQADLVGPYALQAAIASVHAVARAPVETDWGRIVSLYDLLLLSIPSPVVELNRAVAVAMRDGPEAGLALIAPLLRQGAIAEYHLAHAAQADLCRRLGRVQDARIAYARALQLAKQAPEQRFLKKRLQELDAVSIAPPSTR